MKKILVLGAGMSASSLIRYLLEHATPNNWQVRVVDQSIDLVQRKLNNHPNGVALVFNALSREERLPEIEKADLVISMLPARFHIDVANDCLSLGRNLITPSYVSPEMQALSNEVAAAGLLFMNEIGVDPGIDHMSAMAIIDEVRSKKGTITSFKSYCGGLIAPESDNNPWNYKFTWNPRNVVLAGQGKAAQYIDRSHYKYITYNQLFTRLDRVEVAGFGAFDGYANRDSLSYRPIYGLESIPTLYRGTLRRVGFCQAWNIFVQLGLTDDSYIMEGSENFTPRDFINAFLPFSEGVQIEDKWKAVCHQYGVSSFEKFEWLGLFDSSVPMGIKNATPAQLLESILVKKWVLEPADKDMLVMVHQFEYELNEKKYHIESSMVNIGEDDLYTSMSNTVGLPMAICAKMMLNGEVAEKGVQIPIMKSVYEPILKELAQLGIAFVEQEIEL
jgi:saccharopine dehydrogenase-like NADP-dependent oxidoreductase